MPRKSKSSLTTLSTSSRMRIRAEALSRHLHTWKIHSKHHLLVPARHSLPFGNNSTLPFISATALSAHKEKISFTIDHAWSSATAKKYTYGVAHFLAFCTENQIPARLTLPASEFTLCAFAASSSGIRAGSTIRNDLAAVRAWHISQGVEWNGSTQLTYVLKGADNLTPSSSFAALRPPVSINMILLLHKNLDLSSHFDSLTFFCACSAFWAQLRLGEILSESENLSTSSRFPSLSNLSPPNQNGSRTLFLPHTKTANSRGEFVMLCKQYGLSDPISTLHLHLSINRLSPSDPLFSYLKLDGKRVLLTKRKFLLRCNSIWSSHGIVHTTGHSFRIGGTTHLLLSKVPPDIVKALGRWSSDSFLRYWRSLDLLGPIYTEFLDSTSLPIPYSSGGGPSPQALRRAL